MPYIHTLTVQLPHILEESNERISKTGRLLHYPIRHPRFTAKGIATRNHVSPDSTHQIWKGRQLLPCKSNFSRGRERRTETTTDSSCNGKSPSSIKQSQEDKRTKEIDCCSVLTKGRTYLKGGKKKTSRAECMREVPFGALHMQQSRRNYESAHPVHARLVRTG